MSENEIFGKTVDVKDPDTTVWRGVKYLMVTYLRSCEPGKFGEVFGGPANLSLS
jgi:hypothetical protein